MCSESVIIKHLERVTCFVEESLTSGSADVLLLQEISDDVKSCVLELCDRLGFAAHFSTKCDDAKKCNAITAIIAKCRFDEVTEIEIVRKEKVRRFAAVR